MDPRSAPPTDLAWLRAVLAEQLRAGAIVDLPRVAGRVGKSRRTLQRVIAAAGTSFRALVQDVRREMALELLATGDLTVERVSIAVGYSDPSALRRAFQRWGELTPSSVRLRMARTGRGGAGSSEAAPP